MCDRNLGRPGIHIFGEENAVKQQVAIIRRANNGGVPAVIDENSRICAPCNISIVQELELLENDPDCLRINVLTQASSHSCCICGAVQNIHRLSQGCRAQIFIKRNIYATENTRACRQHLDRKGLLTDHAIGELRFVNRPYKIKGHELGILLQNLRDCVRRQKESPYEDEDDFTDEEFSVLCPISKLQFNDLFTHCEPVQVNDNEVRYINRKDLLAFLCKTRQGITDDFVKVIFKYSSRQTVSDKISLVRKSLMARFVPENIGLHSLTRDQYIERHVTEFSNRLFNPQPEIPRAIVLNDCTYLYIEKSSCFKALRQSYSQHKGRHLIKPSMLVAPDGYILDIQGPYFSNAANNDANILVNELNRDGEEMREWFQGGDLFVVDRGYRDAIPTLQRLGIDVRMPALIEAEERQLTTEAANATRLVTKIRWIVEARNGLMKLLFKFLKDVISTTHLKNIRDFLLIFGAVINKYHPPIIMQDANIELADRMLERVHQPNIVHARVEAEGLRNRRGRWQPLIQAQQLQFPELNIDALRELTLGVFQINLAPGYIQDNMLDERQAEFQYDQDSEAGFIRVRLFSRYRGGTRHQLWISFDQAPVEGADNPILGTYCTCQTGARTVGTCAHVAAVVWYLGHARNQAQVKYPSTMLLDRVLDVRNVQQPEA